MTQRDVARSFDRQRWHPLGIVFSPILTGELQPSVFPPDQSDGTGGGIKLLLIRRGDVRVRAAAAAEEKMVLIKEYRVILPCSVEEYQVGQLFSVAEASKNETGGGEGIEVLKNEPYEKEGEKGQYTHKIYHLKSKVPGFVKMIAPEGALVFHEKAWNAYPYCRTIVTNEYMKDDFFIKIETWHKPDMGTIENVHELDPNTWKCVEVVPIDIADRSQVEHSDYKTDEDPAIFQSVKTGRGPLGADWKKELAGNQDCPRMCAYKLVTVKFKWWGLQNKIEHFIHKQEKRIFTNFHRQLFCWIDKWVELTMADIRRMEDETQKELEEMRKKGSVRGTSAADD
ncbi:phosphatidylinositol transfer protein beta isoform-like isoform X2 [Polyodon spathula]|uniref:phosphatidylinositol transfer protein beta isoform-like isoform X2 n=1 Tax=Polyodon spathula TaxID=7913 RepID=UPI001B7E9B25|nr:phosphatidylinositol transfer protein beta isoform-like isoform X2 [Polyodon spathula]